MSLFNIASIKIYYRPSCKKSYKLRWAFFLLTALYSLVPSARAALYSGGGTLNNPYEIWTPAEMNDIGNNPGHWGGYFKLIDDIDLSGYTGSTFNIIGNNTTKFTGIFDGNGKKILNFAYSGTEFYIGIFGVVDGGIAEIKDLGLVDPNVDGRVVLGSLVGDLRNGTISNCYVQGGSVSGYDQVGGLVGYNSSDGTISSSYATCSVSGWWYLGGLVGYSCGEISNSYATGSISGDRYLGGLVGQNGENATISKCYSIGNVSGNRYLGGLVGYSYGEISNSYATGSISGGWCLGGLVGLINGENATISKCYSIGNVSGTDYAYGGLVGLNVGTVGLNAGTVEYCFWDVDTSGQSSSAGGSGAMGKTTTEMQTMSTFTDYGWDFVYENANGTEDIWRICCGKPIYPKLAWQELLLGDFASPEGVDFVDFAFFAAYWLDDGLGPCGGADLTGDGTVDMNDLFAFTEYWLEGLPIYYFPLNTDPGWTTENQWAFGQPTGQGGTEWSYPDPTSGYTGTNVYGVNLNGDVEDIVGGPYYLTTEPFDFSGCSNVKLRFARWLNTDWASYESAKIEVSNNGSSWNLVWVHNEEDVLADSDWQIVEYDISPTAAGESAVYIRWSYAILIQDYDYPLSGWNIDDIQLLGQQ